MKHRFHFSVRHAMILLRRTRWMSTAGEQCREPQREKHTLCLEDHALYPTLTSTCWITFHIKPLRFHCSLLCVSPAAFVARAMSPYCPRFLGFHNARERRHEYFPISGSSRATTQIAPPCVPPSTRRLP